MSRRLTHSALAALTAAALLAAAPTAYAIWTAAGTGSAAAATATPQPVTIAPGAAATRSLYPTGTPTGDVAVSITNPNPYRVHVALLVLDEAAGGDGFSPNASACGLEFTPAARGWDVPAGETVEVDLPAALTMATTAPASCQGLAVSVYLKAAP
jgi:hypothetical protein